MSTPYETFNPTYEFNTPVAISGRADHVNQNNNDSFFGAIDELSVYNRALSATEIQSIYNAKSADKCTNAVEPPAIILSGMTETYNYLAIPNPLLVNHGSFVTLGRQNNQLSIALFGDTGSNYMLQASTNLINWTNVGAVTPVAGVIQTNATISGNTVFFRAESSH